MAGDVSLEGDEATLYAAVPGDGRTITNPALRTAVGWAADDQEDRYFAARDALEDAGLIARGRGRGGTVRRVVREASTEYEGAPVVAETPEEVKQSLGREMDLYGPMRDVIAADWARDRRANPIAVEVTALQGRRPTGIWARPDIVSVDVRTFAHVPGRHIEVITFEVKPSDAITVQAVYEALAHRRAATHSYVLLHVPDDRRDELDATITEIAEVARGHGIGLITAADPGDYETWEEREVAQRVEPDPARLDAFLGQQVSESVQRNVSLAVR